MEGVEVARTLSMTVGAGRGGSSGSGEAGRRRREGSATPPRTENWEAGVGCGVGNGKAEFPAWHFSLAGLQSVGREMPGSGAQTCMGARD